MSSAYDPRRSRPRPTPVPDPDAAPIEALLGPEPESERSDARAAGPQTPPTAGASAQPPRPMPATRSGAPSPVVQLAPLVVLVTVIAALVWWLSRRRARGRS